MNQGLRGKKALIIGGSGGIGRQIVLELASRGVALTVHGRTDSAGFRHLCVQTGAKSLIFPLDTSTKHGILEEAVAGTDILCVAWGPFLSKKLHDTTVEQWENLVSNNLILPGQLVSAVLPEMMSRGWGRILLFGGTRTDVVRGFSSNAAYAAAKTALSSLTRSVAENYGCFGITCNLICPGFVDTEYLSDGQRRELALKNSNGSLISTKEIASAAVCLLESPSCNGVLLPIDQGWTP